MTHPLNCSVLDIGAPGPEDIALVPSTPSRLLISSLDRRQANSKGDIYVLDTESRRISKMTRVNEPENFIFRPHGLDTLKVKNGNEYLYVVAHGPGKIDYAWHKIVQYEIVGDQLRYIDSLTGPALVSPNDVAVDPTGTLIFSNDGTKHFISSFLKIKRGNIVGYHHHHHHHHQHQHQHQHEKHQAEPLKEQPWRTMVDQLIYANGVLLHEEKAYVADSQQNQILQYDIATNGSWHTPRVLASIPRPDNLSLSDHWLYSAGHLSSTWAFVRHFLDRSGKHHSSSALYRTHIHTGETQVLFASDGADISALSGAQVSGRSLYASAIFDAKLLACDL